MRILLGVFCILFYPVTWAQILSTDDGGLEVKEEVKEITEEPIPKSGLEIYFGISPAYTYRTLEEREGIFGKDPAYRTAETGEWVSSFSGGIRNELNKHLFFEVGVGYFRNRVSYDFKEPDSVFSYIHTYRHIAFPVRIAYTYGKDVSLYGALGVIPKAFIGMKEELTTLDISNKETTEERIFREGYNLILLDAVASLGTRIKFNRNYGIFALIEARTQLTDNFDKQSPFVRRPYALGFNVGFQIYL
ncbi:MAG: hypothetical protein R3277_06000 [Brumimicrobium sp.]|nr:hypothetical protein [Brumimicrobium sp.]